MINELNFILLFSDIIPVGVGISGLDGVTAADIVIIAIPFAHYSSLPVAQLRDKIVVDVSNRATVRRTSELSQAEQLARLLPHSKVVKGFNVLSAYSLGESRLYKMIISSQYLKNIFLTSGMTRIALRGECWCTEQLNSLIGVDKAKS